eukprot:GILI01006494.1.p1 GENE.GILI01006494.1~~GILI01006494.1.p1  ORF type:complete len:289 (-),score=79.01 GILI01006494.1:67-933(-)
MRNLLLGIIDWRRRIRPAAKDRLKDLALGQSPDVLYFGCADSRVAVNVFASTRAGDLFVVRNVGNVVPPSFPRYHTPNTLSASELGSCGCSLIHGSHRPEDHTSTTTISSGAKGESVAAAIEFAVGVLNVRHIVVCGHSQCGAMRCLLESTPVPDSLTSWLHWGKCSLDKLKKDHIVKGSESFAKVDQLSMINVLEQIEHVKTYDIVKQRMSEGRLKVHGWWFDIGNADVYYYNDSRKEYSVLDEEHASEVLTNYGETDIDSSLNEVFSLPKSSSPVTSESNTTPWSQ